MAEVQLCQPGVLSCKPKSTERARNSNPGWSDFIDHPYADLFVETTWAWLFFEEEGKREEKGVASRFRCRKQSGGRSVLPLLRQSAGVGLADDRRNRMGWLNPSILILLAGLILVISDAQETLPYLACPLKNCVAPSQVGRLRIITSSLLSSPLKSCFAFALRERSLFFCPLILLLPLALDLSCLNSTLIESAQITHCVTPF